MPSPQQPPSSPRTTFRLPALAYLAVLFLFFCVAPFAFIEIGSTTGEPVLGPQLLVLLVPVAAAAFIARTATIVGPEGICVRALLAQELLPWESVRGLAVEGRTVYAVLDDGGAMRLPCVRVADLAAVSRASGGRLPEIAEARPKFAPSRRRRRR